MTAPIDALIDPGHQSLPSPEAVCHWRLPETDRKALAEQGLPDDQLMTPGFQFDTAPTLVPNVAGELERRLITPADRLFDLGRWGSHDLTPKMGAVQGDGRVLALRPAPVTAADLHPGLRDHYRDLYQPAVGFINSSVTQLIEISWRWRAVLPILAGLSVPDGPGSDEEIDAYYARREECERIVLEGIERIDPAISAADPRTFWGELVTDPGW